MSSRSLITRSIPSLFNGISQQPDTLRLPSQAETQVNMLSTVGDGVMKRPGTQIIAKITTDDVAAAHMHSINRDVGSRYQVVCTDGDVRVFDITDGTEKTVSFQNWGIWTATTAYIVGHIVYPTTLNGFMYRCSVAGTTSGTEPASWDTTLGGTTADGSVTWVTIPHYLQADDPINDFALVTVADYTFFVNKTVVTQLRDLPIAVPPGLASQFTPDTWKSYYGNDQFFNPLGNATLDGWVQTFSDLPSSPLTDDYYRVAGFDEDQFGGYYVRYTADNVWVETYGEDSNEMLDEATMPHVLVDNLDGTFKFVPFKWIPRRFGDVATNPKPTYVGRKLNDVFFYKNRLGLLSDENVVFSGAGDFGNFFRNTVTTLLDSDVVDVAVSTSKVSKLNFAVPFNNTLMLFSDQTQFSLNVDELLTPTSVSIDVVTAYEMDQAVDPLRLNSEVYFITKNGAFSRVREYYVAADSNNTLAADITAHCPVYLPSDIKQLAGSGNDDIMFALATGDEDNRLYVYKFHWQGDTKAQSSWSYWEMSVYNQILSINVIENVLYLLVKRTDGTWLEKIDFASGAVAGALTHDVLVDNRTLIETGDMSYDGGTNRTTITLPYEVGVGDRSEFYFLYVDRTNLAGAVVVAPISLNWNSLTEVEIWNGDFTSYDMFAGVNYDCEYEFTQLFNATSQGIAITTGRTQVRTMTVYYSDANFFQTEVDPYGKNTPTLEDVHPQYLWSFSGKTLGDGALQLGEPLFIEGAYQFSIGGNSRDISIKLKNNFPYQSKFHSAEWEALYFNRSR